MKSKRESNFLHTCKHRDSLNCSKNVTANKCQTIMPNDSFQFCFTSCSKGDVFTFSIKEIILILSQLLPRLKAVSLWYKKSASCSESCWRGNQRKKRVLGGNPDKVCYFGMIFLRTLHFIILYTNKMASKWIHSTD